MVGKKNKKKSGNVPIAAPKMKSRRKARQITSAFHTLTHALTALQSDVDLSLDDKVEKIEKMQGQITAMGGREAYQDASILSTELHKTSKYVFQLLTKYDLRPRRGQVPLEVLEVGAINAQLLQCSWLKVMAIDLMARHENIVQMDFFTLTPTQHYNVVVSSMVLNCVPEPTERGRMLKMYRSHLQKEGLLFLMLPLLCLNNSNHISYDSFLHLLVAVGFTIRDCKTSAKVAFFCLQRIETVGNFTDRITASNNKSSRKRRNDFNVLL